MKQKRDKTISAGTGPKLFDISEFADIVHDPVPPDGMYRAIAKETGQEIGTLSYALIEIPSKLIRVASNTHPDWRRRKIGAALIDRMCADYPDYFVDVGGDSGDKLQTPGFYHRLKQLMPYFDSTVIQEGARD